MHTFAVGNPVRFGAEVYGSTPFLPFLKFTSQARTLGSAVLRFFNLGDTNASGPYASLLCCRRGSTSSQVESVLATH